MGNTSGSSGPNSLIVACALAQYLARFVIIRSSQAQIPAMRLVRRGVFCDANQQPKVLSRRWPVIEICWAAALSGGYFSLGPQIHRTLM